MYRLVIVTPSGPSLNFEIASRHALRRCSTGMAFVGEYFLRWETIGVVGKARHMRGCFCPCHTHATRGGEESPAWLPTSWSRAPLAILTLRITTALKQQAKTSATGPL